MLIERTIDKTRLLPITRESAAKFVQLADEFGCSIVFQAKNLEINAKSLLGLMALGKVECRHLCLVCDGPDESEAMERLLEHIETKQKLDKL